MTGRDACSTTSNMKMLFWVTTVSYTYRAFISLCSKLEYALIQEVKPCGTQTSTSFSHSVLPQYVHFPSQGGSLRKLQAQTLCPKMIHRTLRSAFSTRRAVPSPSCKRAGGFSACVSLECAIIPERRPMDEKLMLGRKLSALPSTFSYLTLLYVCDIM
jgi:hypothetical protein